MDFGSAFTYPTRDPDWVKKALIGGVLWMIPIANFIQVGHLLAVAEEVSQGADQQLPRWEDFGGFFKKGLGVVAITVAVMLPMILLLVCGYGLVIGLLVAGEGGGEALEGALNVGLIAVQCVAIVLGLVSALFIAPALSEYIVAGNLRAALDPRAILAEFRARAGQYLSLGLFYLVGGWVASLVGAIACGVGLLLTLPYFSFVFGHLLGQLVAARRIQ